MPRAYDLHITGLVQGVGFRPFVYRLATRYQLSGWVLNSTDGVHAHIEGEDALLKRFLESLELESPPAAQIDRVRVYPGEFNGEKGFAIRPSAAHEPGRTRVSPDLATCADCLHELFDTSDRRYAYPFINCTNCGPRFTIIEGLPYDRPLTSMSDFTMCEACAREYADPGDRRFHAQPDACFDCGPHLSLRTAAGRHTAYNSWESQALIAEAAGLLQAGGILALKGLGGYHLACSATDESAVQRLRERKQRPDKPLACMFRDLGEAREYCEINDQEEQELRSPAAPIVLLRCRAADWAEAGTDGMAGGRGAGGSGAGGSGAGAPGKPGHLAPSVHPGLREVGALLPYTPLHHLLLAEFGGVLVMTSGNLSEEPIIGDNTEAHQRLDGIADGFLDHDRLICSRYDDSVVRIVDGQRLFQRRARGFAPTPLPLPAGLADEAPLLAVGAEQKNCFCLTRGSEAFVSQHLGELDDADSFENWDATRALYERLFGARPKHLAADLHPDYLSSKWAVAQSRTQRLPLTLVQHHHAHIAAILGEYQAKQGADAPEQVLGLAFDGTGLGDDGTIWGGEVLLASLCGYRRLAHLRCVRLPGGAAAIREPSRMAFAWLWELGLLGHSGAAGILADLGETAAGQLGQLIEKGLNSPWTSSMGRLFDAVSALLGVCRHPSYDGQAAIELEAAIGFDSGSNGSNDDDSTCGRGGGGGRGASGGDSVHGGGSGSDDGDGTSGNGSGGNGSGGGMAPTAPSVAGLFGQFACTNTGASSGAIEIDPRAVFEALLAGLAQGRPAAELARGFHLAVADLVCSLSEQLCREHRLSHVALGGGVFMNAFILKSCLPRLKAAGLQVLMSQELPAGDGCIAYGQAVVALSRAKCATINDDQ